VEIERLRDFLNLKVQEYNRPGFIPNDPVSIPHLFTRKQDIEIAALWAAILAWGQRKTIISKCKELFQKMDNAPYDFVLNHKESELKRFLDFRHRTFNVTDTLYFIHFFKWFYQKYDSLEEAFIYNNIESQQNVEQSLILFHDLFFSLTDYPERTRKHIASPKRNSACKRLNMFLRWMVRKDSNGVDFGIWSRIKPAQLVCPCDLHVERVGRKLGLITKLRPGWDMAIELTAKLRLLDPEDPVKYDFALFGLGVEEKF